MRIKTRDTRGLLLEKSSFMKSILIEWMARFLGKKVCRKRRKGDEIVTRRG